MADRTLPVPETVAALYIVLTDGPTGIGGPSAPPVPPASLLLARGASIAQADRVEALRHATPVLVESPLAGALAGEREAQTSARALAVEHDGIVVDTSVPRVLPETPPVDDHLRAVDWFVLEHLAGDVLTCGLGRFGLPELRCIDVPDDLLPMYDAVLTGVVQRVAEEWPGNDPAGPATITLRDIARGYGDSSAGGDDPTLDRSVDVTLAYDSGAHLLDVTLHDDPAATLFAP